VRFVLQERVRQVAQAQKVLEHVLLRVSEPVIPKEIRDNQLRQSAQVDDVLRQMLQLFFPYLVKILFI